jgi:hypothetical protein
MPRRCAPVAQAAESGAAVAVIEDQRELRAAIEDAVEQRPQFFVANVEGAEARVGGDDRFVQSVELIGRRVRHLRTVARKVIENDVPFAGRLDEVLLDRLQNGRTRGLLVFQCHDLPRIEAVQELEHLAEDVDVVCRALEVRPAAVIRIDVRRPRQNRCTVVVDADQQRSSPRHSLSVRSCRQEHAHAEQEHCGSHVTLHRRYESLPMGETDFDNRGGVNGRWTSTALRRE